jgi:STAS-like domain of unknown function (DUF4325)
MVVFRLAKISLILKNRSVAAEIRKEVINKLENGEKVVLDFSRIEGVSRAFAEELIGKLTDQIGVTAFSRKVRVENVSSRVSRTLERALLQDKED